MTDTDDTYAELAEIEAFEADRKWLLHTDTAGSLERWERYERRHDAQVAIERGEDLISARQIVDDTPVSALDALGASRELIELLMERRWYVIQDAREGGASWTEIGSALGMTKQGAHDWYRRAIEKRAAVDEAHDAERAARAL